MMRCFADKNAPPVRGHMVICGLQKPGNANLLFGGLQENNGYLPGRDGASDYGWRHFSGYDYRNPPKD